MFDPDAFAEMVVSTIKSALAPVQADVRALQGQVAAQDARWNDIGALRERVAVVEAQASRPPDLHDVNERLYSLQLGQEMSRAAEQAIVTEVKALSDMRERVAVLETRAPVPGPAGKDGADGKDGLDGLGFDDLDVEFNGDRTLSLKFSRGDVVKVFPLILPFLKYQGVWESKAYEAGDVVTWAGSTWYAKEATTTKPGDVIGSAHWVLCVKKGRDGRDGKDGRDAVLPVVQVGR